MIHRKLNQLFVESVSHNPDIKKKVIVRKGEMGNITQVALASFPPGQIAPEHKHDDMFETFIVQKGQGEITIDNRVMQVREGDCIVVSPGEKHEIKNIGTEVMEVLNIGEEIN